MNLKETLKNFVRGRGILFEVITCLVLEKTLDICGEMLDVHDTIRHFLACKHNPEGGYAETYSKPMHFSQDKLPDIEETD